MTILREVLSKRIRKLHHKHFCDPECSGDRACNAPGIPSGQDAREFSKRCASTVWRFSALRSGYIPTTWNPKDEEHGWFIGYSKKDCLDKPYYRRMNCMVTFQKVGDEYLFTKQYDCSRE